MYQFPPNRRHPRRHRLGIAGLVLSLAIALAACGSDDSPQTSLDGPLALPADWAGEWDLEITFRDPGAGGAVVAVERIIDCIAAGESLVQPLVPSFSECSGTVTGDHLEVTCRSTIEENGCRVDVQLNLGIDRVDDMILGTGEWSAVVAGSCGDAVSGGEDIEVAGFRSGTAAADCGGGGQAIARQWTGRAEGLLR